ncbi:MAG: SRPBCC family protein [Ilumatobacteraceae bacterium]
MARYVTTVRTPMPPEASFAYMADLRHFSEWDPGVKRVVQVEGDGGGSGTEFDVTVSGTTLRYRTLAHRAPEELVVVARSRTLTSTDKVLVRPDGEGSLVTYDAVLELNGPLRLFDPLLKLAFGRIGERAAAGLRAALGGVDVPS